MFNHRKEIKSNKNKCNELYVVVVIVCGGS